MPRAHIQGVAIYEDAATGTLKKIANPTVTVYEPGTTTPISQALYDAPSGGSVLANPFTGTPDAHFQFWVALPQTVKIVLTGLTGGSATIDHEETLTISTAGEINLDDFRAGVVINTGVNSARPAFLAAFATASASGAKIRLSANSIYSAYNLQPPTGVVIEGSGPSTVVKHPNTTNDEVFDLSLTSRVTISDFTLDGNAANNNHVTGGWEGAEIDTGGTDNTVRNVWVRDPNAIGISCHGLRWTVEGCDAIITTPRAIAAYLPTSGTGGSKDFGGLNGFLSPGTSVSTDGRFVRNRAGGFRGPGIAVGGRRLHVEDAKTDNCHRSAYPWQTSALPNPPGIVESGGGQFAITETWSGTGTPGLHADAVRTTGTLLGVDVGDSPDSLLAGGIEIGYVQDFKMIGFSVDGVPQHGVSIDDSIGVTLSGGAVRGTSQGVRINNSDHVTIAHTDLFSNTVGVRTEGTSKFLVFDSVGMKGNATNWQLTSSDFRYSIMNPRIEDGDVQPARMATELTVTTVRSNTWAAQLTNSAAGGSGATSDGARIQGGTSVFDTLISLFGGGSQRFTMSGTGAVTQLAASGAQPYRMSRGETSAALLAYLSLERNGVAKAFLGLNSSDKITFLKAAGTASGFIVDQEVGDFTAPGNVIAANIITSASLFSGSRIYARGQSSMFYDVVGQEATIATGSTLPLVTTTPQGLIIVHDGSNGLTRLVVCQAGASVTNVGGDAGFTVGTDTGTDIAIFTSAGALVIKNRSGANRVLGAQQFGR